MTVVKKVRPDSKGRITLGRLAEGVSGFAVIKEGHRIILEPYAEIPAHEKWLYENKAAHESVEQGLKDAAEGRVKSLGDFVKKRRKKINN